MKCTQTDCCTYLQLQLTGDFALFDHADVTTVIEAPIWRLYENDAEIMCNPAKTPKNTSVKM